MRIVAGHVPFTPSQAHTFGKKKPQSKYQPRFAKYIVASFEHIGMKVEKWFGSRTNHKELAKLLLLNVFWARVLVSHLNAWNRQIADAICKVMNEYAQENEWNRQFDTMRHTSHASAIG